MKKETESTAFNSGCSVCYCVLVEVQQYQQHLRFHGCRRSGLERLSARIIICIIVMAREITPETNI